MTIIAFEALAVATALPTAARSLHGLAGYGWAFTGFLVASIVGMVRVGHATRTARARDCRCCSGLVLFIAGLVIASAADQMWVLIAARVVQGFAVGLLITAMYVVMGEVYPDEVRPRMFAALATSWVVPGLVGPVAGRLDHRAVLLALGVRRPGPVRGAGRADAGAVAAPAATSAAGEQASDQRRIWFAVLTALGIAGVAGVGEHQNLLSIVLAVVGLAAMVLRAAPAAAAPAPPGSRPACRRPSRSAACWPAVFVGMEVLVPLTLRVQRHYSPTMAGLPLMLTAVSWAAASQMQGRAQNPNRARLSGDRAGAARGRRARHGAGRHPVGAGLGGVRGLADRRLRGRVRADQRSAWRCWNTPTTPTAARTRPRCSWPTRRMAAVSAAFSGALVALAAHGRISYGAGFVDCVYRDAGRDRAAGGPAGVRLRAGRRAEGSAAPVRLRAVAAPSRSARAP